MKLYKRIPNAALYYLRYAIYCHREKIVEAYRGYINNFEEAKIMIAPIIATEWKDLMEAYYYFNQENPTSSPLLWQEIHQTTVLLKSDERLRALIEEKEALFDELQK
jgi:hypothetical protein